METTVLVMSGADDPATLLFIAPCTGAAATSDLTKHAQGYREMCLLLRRPPAREAYPGYLKFKLSQLKLPDSSYLTQVQVESTQVSTQLKFQLNSSYLTQVQVESEVESTQVT